MWYLKTITVKQNPHFYNQEGVSNHAVNKKDEVEYTFEGNLGAWFKSNEKKEPKVTDRRWIFETEFYPYTYYKRGNIFNKTYEIWWIPCSIKNDTIDIKEFYEKHIKRGM
jgi:hypothetical protein